jgi:hypothetical protein
VFTFRLLVAIIAICWFAAPAAAAPAPTLHVTPEGQQRARSITLTQRDFPAGWKPDPQWRQDSPLGLFKPPCRGVNPNLSDATITGSWSSRNDLVTGNHAQIVINGVILFETNAQAHSMFERLVLPWAQRCVTAGQSEGGVRIDTAQRLRFAAEGGDVLGVRYSVSQAKAPTRLYTDTIFVRVGASVAMMLVVRDASPFDGALERQLVSTIRTRMSLGIA